MIFYANLLRIYPIMVLAKGIGAVVAVEYIIGTSELL